MYLKNKESIKDDLISIVYEAHLSLLSAVS